MPGQRPSPQTMSEFCALASRIRAQHPDWRWGQALFNTLYEVNPEWADAIRNTPQDPFHLVEGQDGAAWGRFSTYMYILFHGR